MSETMSAKLRPLGWRLLACLLLAACGLAPAVQSATPTPFTGQPRSVIVDTDMAGDDWMAILYLLQRPDVKVEAITVTGAGEAHCGPGVRHALGLVALSGRSGIPVACGRETPLEGNHTFPAEWRAGVDSLYSLSLPEGSNASSNQTAVERLTTTIQSSLEKVLVLTLGPLTNVAEALQATPSLADKIEMIYIMGGAVDVPGNVGASGVGIDNPAAEWNIYVDPHAANVVLQSGAPVTLVPLDATNHAPVTTKFYQRLKDQHASPEATFVFDLLTGQQDFIQSGGYYFWDPLAAAILTDESLVVFEAKSLRVVEAEGPESGWTQTAADGGEVQVAVSADGKRFEQIFLDTLNAP
jgi:pyrimidine-specific ribonucleoside hydrolase